MKNTIMLALSLFGLSHFGISQNVQNPKPCCDGKQITASMQINNGNINLQVTTGNVPIQELEISVMDYHADYNEKPCKPANMGIFGNLNSTTGSIGSLNLNATSQNTQSLYWNSNSGYSLSNQSIQLNISQPNVLPLKCCSVKLYFCLKIKIKDINCKVCEKIICPDSIKPDCDCGQRKSDSIVVNITENGQSKTKVYKCGDKINDVKPNALSNLTLSFPKYSCKGNNCDATYKWNIRCAPNNTICKNGTGNIIQTSGFTNPGLYTISMYASCGGKICDSCTLQFYIVPLACKCNDSATFTYDNGNGNKTPIRCGNTLIRKLGSTITIYPTALCLPNTGCLTQYSYQINDLQTDVFVTGQSMIGSNPFTFTFNSPAGYKITVTYYCNGAKCTCTFYVRTKP